MRTKTSEQRKIRDYNEYFGILIFRSSDPSKLRYTANLGDGLPLAADTLAGIKQMVKERLGKD